MGIVHGIDVNGRMYELKIDANGRILAVIDAVTGTYLSVNVNTMPITQVKGSNNNHIIAYESAVLGILSNTNLSTGENFLTTGAVPTNKLWVITSLSINYSGVAIPTVIQGQIYGSGVGFIIAQQLGPTLYQWYVFSGVWYLSAGEVLRARVDGATAGDDLYFSWRGYQMDLS